MKVGWLGLGRLGLPCALSLAHYGRHEVIGYDVSDTPARILAGEVKPHREEELPRLLGHYAKGSIPFRLADSPAELATGCDAVIVAVQTPHAPEYGGDRPAPAWPADFDYRHLREAVSWFSVLARDARRTVPVIVLSTVTPGTMEREVAPVANPYTPLAYSPAFISLGTAVRDFTQPDFILSGGTEARAAVRRLWEFTAVTVVETSFATAELIKMASNMYDTLKITFADWIMQAAHTTGADSALVAGVLRRRKGFPAPGMPDGGPCRPRDLVALSWLNDKLGLPYNLPAAIGSAREAHARWLADLTCHEAAKARLGVVLAGGAYKPESDLTDGSPALLVRHYVTEGYHFAGAPVKTWDVPRERCPSKPAVFLIATRYPELGSQAWPQGSVVIDPWGIVDDQEGVRVIRVGRCAR